MKTSPPPLPDHQASDETSNKEHDVSLSSTAVDAEPDLRDASTATAHAVLDWDGPDDTGNPKNWSVLKKIFHTAIPALYGFSVAFGTSVYSPGIQQFASRFGCSVEVATLGLSLYAEGLAFGPMIGAPISETLGRKAVYLYTMPIYLLFVLGTGLANTTAQFLILRFLAGLFGAPSLAIGAGTIADVWEMEHGGGLATVLIVQTFFLGPSLGPLIGGFAFQQRGTWRWLMWTSLLVSGPLYAMVLCSSETSKKELLRRRAKSRGLPGPPKPPPAAALKALFVITLFRPLKMLLTEPIVTLVSIYNAFAFAVLFAFFAAYPYVFDKVYGFQADQVGLAFLGILIGTVLAIITFVIIDKTVYQKAKMKCPPGTIPPPEQRLYSSMLGSFGIPIGLFWFAWSARSDIHWISPILAGVPFGWGMCALFVSGMTYLVDTYQALYGASAIAANGLLRYTLGAAFPLFTLQMYERLGIGWATSLLGFISVAMMPIPWVLWKWGPALRAKSQFKPERLIG